MGKRNKIIKDKNMHCPKCKVIALWFGILESGYAKYYCPNCYYQWDSYEIHTINLVKE